MSTVTVITGGAGGMGGACASVLAPDVDAVLLTDIDAARLADAAGRLAAEGTTAVHHEVADLADPRDVVRLRDRAAELGTLRALVHTAGLSPAMAPWREILRVDLVATASLLEELRPAVVPGSVAVCIASIAGHMGGPDPALDAILAEPLAPDLCDRYRAEFDEEPDPGITYALAKRAVITLCARSAVTWGARGGRVVSLSPGLIDTEMGRLEVEHQPVIASMAAQTPVGAARGSGDTILPGLMGDIAGAVAFLCSDAAAFVSGCDLRVDGGLVAAIEQRGLG